MTSRDVADILNLSDHQQSQQPIVHHQQPNQNISNRKPNVKGLPRELVSLMGDNATSVVAAQDIFKKKPKLNRDVNKWAWKPFKNQARNDNLTLHHWVKVNEEEGEYAFAKYNTSSQPYSYSSDEYDRMLKDDGWSKDETDYLINLIHEFNLRWPVIWDRYQWRSGRTLEDIKGRYFDICRKLIQSRISSDETSTSQLLHAYQFDKERETLRKQYINSLFERTREQIAEEEALYVEARRIENDEKKWRSERDELIRIISMNNKNEKKNKYNKEDLFNLNTSSESSSKKSAKSIAFDNTHYIYRTNGNQTASKSHGGNPPPFSRATRLQQRSTPARIKEALVEMNLSDNRLIIPNRENIQRLDQVRDAMVQLIEIKKAHDRASTELRIAKGSNSLDGNLDDNFGEKKRKLN